MLDSTMPKMLDSMMPYYQSGLRNRLCYEIMFNDYDRVIVSTATLSSPKVPDSKYKITDVSLKYEIVTQPDLASRTQWNTKDRILRNRQIPVNKSDITWSWSLNMTGKSLKGILVLFEEEVSYK